MNTICSRTSFKIKFRRQQSEGRTPNSKTRNRACKASTSTKATFPAQPNRVFFRSRRSFDFERAYRVVPRYRRRLSVRLTSIEDNNKTDTSGLEKGRS